MTKINSEFLKRKMQQLDKEFIRVIEDLIDVLLQKKILKQEDLPASVLDKMKERKLIRKQLQTLEEDNSK